MKFRDLIFGTMDLCRIFYWQEKYTLHTSLHNFESDGTMHKSLEVTIFERCEIVAKFHIADYLDDAENLDAYNGFRNWVGENLVNVNY